MEEADYDEALERLKAEKTDARLDADEFRGSVTERVYRARERALEDAIEVLEECLG